MKKLIFYNDTGFPYAALAAAIHSGALPAHRSPTPNELEQVLAQTGLGRGDAAVYNLGQNEQGESCLALWSRGNGDMIGRVIKSFLTMMRINSYELVHIKCRNNLLVKTGVVLTWIPGLRNLGLSLVYRHILNIYRELNPKRLP